MTSLLATDIYKPDEWREFFLMVGGGGAALTGLVFVAMSLNLHVIAKDATHRYRAIGTLAGFTATFMICALVLMGGQGHAAVWRGVVDRFEHRCIPLCVWLDPSGQYRPE